jgi:hypothetical protein
MASNLIDNALRYGGAARVSLGETTSDWIVTVADDGPGIPPHAFEQAFEPFQRLESSRNRETGWHGAGPIDRARHRARARRADLARQRSAGFEGADRQRSASEDPRRRGLRHDEFDRIAGAESPSRPKRSSPSKRIGARHEMLLIG